MDGHSDIRAHSHEQLEPNSVAEHPSLCTVYVGLCDRRVANIVHVSAVSVGTLSMDQSATRTKKNSGPARANSLPAIQRAVMKSNRL